MAGNYPDKSYFRLPYDGDGTVVLNNSGAEIPVASKRRTNSRNIIMEFTGLPFDGGWGGSPYTFFFPTLMDIFGIGTQSYNSVSTSVDTTTGVDGTWVTRPGASGSSVSVGGGESSLRLKYRVVSWLGIRALKFTPASFDNTKSLILWGSPSSLSVDKLLLWKNGSDARLDPWTLDFGDVARGGVAVTKSFRVKNCSDELKAVAPLVSCESNILPANYSNPTLSYPGTESFLSFSADEVSWSSTLTLGDLDPGEISETVHVRLSVPGTAQLGVQSPRIRVAPASWTGVV